MRWLKRMVAPLEDRWPTRTPPTAPPDGPPTFHCPGCKRVVGDDETRCAACGHELWAG